MHTDEGAEYWKRRQHDLFQVVDRQQREAALGVQLTLEVSGGCVWRPGILSYKGRVGGIMVVSFSEQRLERGLHRLNHTFQEHSPPYGA